MKKIAIMQPYFFPHIAYYQLVKEVDLFVFYDDVNFIKRGWINRNYITLNNNQKRRFTIPLIKSSQNKLINEIYINWDSREMEKLLINIRHSLKNKNIAYALIKKILDVKPEKISDLAIMSIKTISRFLNIQTKFVQSSKQKKIFTNGNMTKKLCDICKYNSHMHYINLIGGRNMYSKSEFRNDGVKLSFLNGVNEISILDILDSHNKYETINNYELI